MAQNKNNRGVKDIPDSATMEDIVENYNELAKMLNFVLKSLSFQNNFNCYIAQISIAAGASEKIIHLLGVTPKWRIILRQEGNGVISDIPSGWNEKFITLKNNGAETVTISVMIARE